MRTKRRIERERETKERQRKRRERRVIRRVVRELRQLAANVRDGRIIVPVLPGATLWVAPVGVPPPGVPDAQGDIWPSGWTKVGEIVGPVEFSHVGGRFRDVSIGYEVRPPTADDGRLN